MASRRPVSSRPLGPSPTEWRLQEALVLAEARSARADAALRALYRIEEKARTVSDLPDLYAEIRVILRDVLNARSFHVVLRDEASGSLTFPYVAGDTNTGLQDRPEWTERVLETGEPLVADGASPRCWLGVPLKAAGKTVGALVVQRQSAEGTGYGEGEKEILGFVVRQVEAALERARVEQEGRRVVSVLQSTLDSTADGILVVDHGGRVLSFNQRFAQLWRIPKPMLEMRDETALLAHVLDQVKDPAPFLSKVRELYSQPDAEAFDELEFKDGRTFERYSIPLRQDGEAVGRVWSFHDVTRSRDLEKRLVQARKLEALSRLAGGVAHDFNDLLTVIGSRGELARKDLPAQDPRRRHLEEILAAADRATGLAHQLLAFSQVETAPPAEALSPAAALPDAPSGHETVLLVEDQEAVRLVVREILEAQGYTVLDAGRGDEARLVGERHRGPIHLIVADVLLPDTTGPELVLELLPDGPTPGYCSSPAMPTPRRARGSSTPTPPSSRSRSPPIPWPARFAKSWARGPLPGCSIS